jgi:hypothetical protein
MSLVPSLRSPAIAAVTGVAVLASGAALATAGAATPAAPKTVTATRITRQPGTLAPGSNVSAGRVVGQRTFISATRGFALANVRQADYAVATTDGGKTWKTDGPALHLDAAQAPLSVSFIGAVNRKTVYAWGGGQVVDTTNDGGRTWRRALFTAGSPVAVVGGFSGHLLAFVQSFSGKSTVEYSSKDGGKTWRR